MYCPLDNLVPRPGARLTIFRWIVFQETAGQMLFSQDARGHQNGAATFTAQECEGTSRGDVPATRRHRFKAGDLGTGTCLQSAIPCGSKPERSRQFHLVRRPAKLGGEQRRQHLPLTDESADLTLEGINGAEVVGHGAADTVLGEGLELQATLRLKAVPPPG